jgi:hypothetical protein
MKVGRLLAASLMVTALASSYASTASRIPQQESAESWVRVYHISFDPASSTLMMGFALRNPESVTVELMGGDGRRLAVPIAAREYDAGDHAEAVQIAPLWKGRYLLKLTAGGEVRTQRFFVIR